VDITAASDVMQRHASFRVSQIHDRIRRYEHLRDRRVASVARHVQRGHPYSTDVTVTMQL